MSARGQLEMSQCILRSVGLAALLGVALWACKDGTGEDLTGPPPEPAPLITVIDPTEAAPDEQVTIRGENFAGTGSLTVTFDGVAARIVSRTGTAIEAIIPDAGPGAVAVVVRVGERVSAPFSFRLAAVELLAILAVVPAQAHPGEAITIVPVNLGDPRGLIVTMAGVRMEILSVSPLGIRAVVPDLTAGRAGIVVKAGNRVSRVFAFEVLQAVPIVTFVSPNPTRAGLSITILGRYFQGDQLRALIDAGPVEILGRGSSQIHARVPAGLAVGTHAVQIEAGGERSQPFSFEVDDFSVTGTYDIRAVLVRANPHPTLCPTMPAVGSERALSIRMTDRRPDLEALVDSTTVVGKVNASGHLQGSTNSTVINGNVSEVFVDGRLRFAIDITIDRLGLFGICSRSERATGFRR